MDNYADIARVSNLLYRRHPVNACQAKGSNSHYGHGGSLGVHPLGCPDSNSHYGQIVTPGEGTRPWSLDVCSRGPRDGRSGRRPCAIVAEGNTLSLIHIFS